jgi:hypothetical protein
MTSSYPPYYMDEIAESPAPIPSAVLMAENIPDIDMKIRDSEFKMKGELIQLRNKVLKIERDVGLCCPNYDKMATNIQSRFRGNKTRIETVKKPDFPNMPESEIIIRQPSVHAGKPLHKALFDILEDDDKYNIVGWAGSPHWSEGEAGSQFAIEFKEWYINTHKMKGGYSKKKTKRKSKRKKRKSKRKKRKSKKKTKRKKN